MTRDEPSLAAGRLTITLFAGLAQAIGGRTLEVPWSGGTVADLRTALVAARPEVGPLLDQSVVAIGSRYVGDDAPVAPGADVAILPPVSGG